MGRIAPTFSFFYEYIEAQVMAEMLMWLFQNSRPPMEYST